MISLAEAKLAGDEVIKTPIGDIELVDNYFNDDASRRLFNEMDFQRAVQSYIWSHPLVSMMTWCDRQTKAFDADPTVEYPAGTTAGGFLDFWQRPVADLGLTGPDQVQGVIAHGSDRQAAGNLSLHRRPQRRVGWHRASWSRLLETARSGHQRRDLPCPDLKYNKDGSTDLYIGAKAPTGFESNYMKTVGDDGWFVYFRLYAPLQPFFDKTFSLPDFERID
jgi:hypothetical protein